MLNRSICIFFVLVAVFLAGCGSTSLQSTEVRSDYKGQIRSLNVVLQVGELEGAFSYWKKTASREALEKGGELTDTRFKSAVVSLKDGFMSNFTSAGVPTNILVTWNKLDSAAAMTKIREGQIVFLRVNSFNTATMPGKGSYWDSGLKWDVEVYDRDTSTNPTGGIVWSTKTGWMMFNFGCTSDGYKICSDRFSGSIVDGLRDARLLGAK